MRWLLTILLGLPLISNAQCIANAGIDTALCSFFQTPTTILGGNPTATGGLPPYTYEWSSSYDYFIGTWNASDWLDDTTAANPVLTDGSADSLAFYLKVTDSLGNACFDTVVVWFSRFAVSLDTKIKYMEQGDSVQLYVSVYGGLHPNEYLWSPGAGLADSTDPYTMASPDTTTFYNLTLTDSIGCQITDIFYVYVWPLGVEQQASNQSFTLFPNPTTGIITIKGTEGPVQVLNVFGQVVLHSSETELDLSTYPRGVYFVRTEEGTRKIVLQ